MGVCNCSMFCCTLLYVHSSIAIIWMGKRELIAFLNLSSCCLVMVERLFLAVPRGCLQFVIVVFPDHTHLLFLIYLYVLRTLLTKILVVYTRCAYKGKIYRTEQNRTDGKTTRVENRGEMTKGKTSWEETSRYVSIPDLCLPIYFK